MALHLYHVPIARPRCYPGSNALCLLLISTIHHIFLSDIDRNHVVPLPAAVSATRSTVAQVRMVHIQPTANSTDPTKSRSYIRRDILRLAFGDRRVHMGLSYQSRYDRDENTEALVEDSKSWQWFGSVCHRPVLENQPPMPMTCRGNHYGPWSDSCSDPWQDSIGMTGWLLSCRQKCVQE